MSDALNRYELHYEGCAFVFGDRDSGYPLLNQPEVTRGDRRTQDLSQFGRDGRRFGADYLAGDTIGFNIAVLPPTRGWRPGLTMHEAFAQAWRADRVRETPGKVAELRHPGRGRVTFGRPRRFAPVYDRIRQGWSGVLADFETIDSTWYSLDVSSVTIGAQPPTVGGLVAPLSAPLTSLDTGTTSSGCLNTGSVPAPVTITVQGPVTGPSVTLYDAGTGIPVWSVTADVALAYDDVLTIDASPWVQAATINNAPANGVLRGSPLSGLTIPAGEHMIEFRGLDETGTSRITFEWRSAHPAL